MLFVRKKEGVSVVLLVMAVTVVMVEMAVMVEIDRIIQVKVNSCGDQKRRHVRLSITFASLFRLFA